MISIKTVNVSKVDFFIPLCYENALITYGDTVGLEFRTGFISAWDFNYSVKKESKKIGETIFDNYNLLDSMLKYCNLQCTFIEISKISDLLEIIDNNLQKKLPTIIHIDSYYVQWSPIYGRRHTDHVGLVCDHDKIKKEVYLIDPGDSSEIKVIDYDFLDKASKFYLQIDNHNNIK